VHFPFPIPPALISLLAIDTCEMISLMRVLVVEDEKKVASFIAKGLQEEGYAVDVLHDGENGASQAVGFDYDLVVLDLMLPGRSGLDVLRTIRLEKTRLPVLILTAKGELKDRVGGLDAGADDYMVKPFAFAELSARVRALLRRGTSEDTRLRLSDLEIDTATRIVRRREQQIDLKPRE
jgi:DNA-binding response OmpR family regulator